MEHKQFNSVYTPQFMIETIGEDCFYYNLIKIGNFLEN